MWSPCWNDQAGSRRPIGRAAACWRAGPRSSWRATTKETRGTGMKWTIGDVTVTKIVELEMTGGTRFLLPQATPEEILPIGWLRPHFADENGRLRMSIHSFIVETADRRIVVDTCLGNDKQGRRIPHWNDRTGL